MAQVPPPAAMAPEADGQRDTGRGRPRCLRGLRGRLGSPLGGGGDSAADAAGRRACRAAGGAGAAPTRVSERPAARTRRPWAADRSNFFTASPPGAPADRALTLLEVPRVVPRLVLQLELLHQASRQHRGRLPRGQRPPPSRRSRCPGLSAGPAALSQSRPRAGRAAAPRPRSPTRLAPPNRPRGRRPGASGSPGRRPQPAPHAAARPNVALWQRPRGRGLHSKPGGASANRGGPPGERQRRRPIACHRRPAVGQDSRAGGQ